MDRAWKRALEGRNTAVVAAHAGSPPEDYPLVVVAVRCDLHEQPLGPLLEARDELARWLGWEGTLDEPVRRGAHPSPRSQLLGERREPRLNEWILSSFQQLAAEANGTVVLMFEAVDFADPATLDALRRMVLRRGWLRVPMVLAFSGEPEGAALDLLRAVEQTEGAAGVVRIELGSAAAPPPTTREVAIPALDPAVLRALRAAATIGPTFESDLVAALLDLDPVEALEVFQHAHDSGVPLDDRGEGRFRWPREWVDELRRGVLPSLAAAWHRRLAELLDESDEELPPQAMRVVPPPSFGRAPAANGRVGPISPTAAAVDPEPAAPAEPLVDRTARPPVTSAKAAGGATADGTLVPIEATPPTEAAMVADEQALEAFAGGPARPQRTSTQDARAARHLAEAGRPDAAIERYLLASEDAAARGSNRLAIDYGREALKVLARLPLTTRRRRLRIEVLARLGRLQWEAAGPGSDFSLGEALKGLEEALALVAPDDAVHLGAGIRALIAGVCYDLGDPKSLERALEELTRASRELHQAGDALGGARLFNDQAAVWVRLGDPVRANHLLTESRQVFERLAATDENARIELAETDHLIARLPLHVKPRPGRENDAIELGLRHARDAERRYRELGALREAARVWETMGRLELRRNGAEEAAEHLTRAVDLQSKLGDMIGLARSSAALAEVLAMGGRVADALAVLGDSIELHAQKGSPLGLAYNRRAFERFQAALEPAAKAELTAEIERLAAQLSEAEALFGRVTLPD